MTDPKYSYDKLCDYYKSKQNQKDMKKQPKLGDRKEVVRFAFFPIIVESRFVWFKRYKVIKEYKSWVEYDSILDDHYPVEEWQTVERKLIRRW